MRPKTVAQTLQELRSEPGIDISRLAAGTTILVETTQGVYEIVVIEPRISLVEITGTDPRLKKPVTGQLLASNYDAEGKVSLPNWIGKNLRMQFKFHNCVFSCSVSLSARVGNYEVF